MRTQICALARVKLLMPFIIWRSVEEGSYRRKDIYLLVVLVPLSSVCKWVSFVLRVLLKVAKVIDYSASRAPINATFYPIPRNVYVDLRTPKQKNRR